MVLDIEPFSHSADWGFSWAAGGAGGPDLPVGPNILSPPQSASGELACGGRDLPVGSNILSPHWHCDVAWF